MRKYSLLYFFCACIILFSCSKSEDRPVSINGTYIGGYEENNNGVQVAKYWKDNVAVDITDGTNNASVTDIFVTDNDVYACGTESSVSGPIAKYWKNNVPVILGNGLSEAMLVNGNDVYVAGWEWGTSGKMVAKYWKNGTAVYLTDGSRDARAYDIAISGTDIYVAGYEEENINGVRVAKYWKNGTPVLLTAGTFPKDASASAILVQGTDVHVCGEEFISNGVIIAKYWKNGITTDLTTGAGRGRATDMIAVGSDVYIVGAEPGGANDKTYYWKNGVRSLVANVNATYTAIAVSGNNIVVAGTVSSPVSGNGIAKYWTNGIETSLTNGVNDAEANSIFIK